MDVWNQQMTKGDTDAPNTIINYTDILCPYCAKFHNATSNSTFDKDYIESGKVRMEIRVTSLLPNNNSTRAGESTYCAADQDRFFDYYDSLINKLTSDYFDRGIGVSKTGPKIPDLDDSYYTDIASKLNMDTQRLSDCLKNNDKLAIITANTQRAIQILPYGSGVPYFFINDWSGSGFTGDYSTVQKMMRAGGVE